MKRSTDRQKAAISFCQEWLSVEFEGNIDSFDEVSTFLASYLDDAKRLYEEVKAEYEAYLWDKY